eukprot:g3698.t1
MSITVGIGQAGSSLSTALFRTLTDELVGEKSSSTSNSWHRRSIESFFRNYDADCNNDKESKLLPRSLLVDTEPRAVASCHAAAHRHGKFEFDHKFDVTTSVQSGAANCWALGHRTFGPNMKEKVLEKVRFQIEQCDYFGGFHVLMSLAGGTGSGVGAYITEALRDNYPSEKLLNTVIWPNECSEVVVANYNLSLSLASILKASNAIQIFDNGHVHEICRELYRISNPSFHEMNRVIARHFAATFLPSQEVILPDSNFSCNDNDYSVQSRLSWPLEHLTHLCPHPGYKLLSTRIVPQMPSSSVSFSAHTWSGIVKHLHQIQITGAYSESRLDWNIQSEEFNLAVASLVVLRGGELFRSGKVRKSKTSKSSPSSHLHSFSEMNRMHNDDTPMSRKRKTTPDTQYKESIENIHELYDFRGKKKKVLSDDVVKSVSTTFQNPKLYASFSIDPFHLSVNENTFSKYDKSCSVISNSQTILKPLNRALNSAENMYHAKAYLHQYEKYGVEDIDFHEAFLQLRQIECNYKSLRPYYSAKKRK